jgi:hypothetical protein
MSLSESAALRRWAYVLMITVAASAGAGRILNTQLVYEPVLHRNAGEDDPRPRTWPARVPRPMPTFSSNDRSRWATVRALVDEGTYVIGRRDPRQASAANPYGDSGIIREDGWGTVDRVLKPDTQEFYSSKPPLLPTLVAGEYWLLKHGLGRSLVEDPWTVVRTVLFTWNLLPFVVYLVLMARLVEELGGGDWSKLYVMAAACFATFLTTFVISLNNHTVAACSALFALYPAVRILSESRTSASILSEPQPFGSDLSEPRPSGSDPADDSVRCRSAWREALLYLGAGFFAAFTAANELPALAFAVGLFLVLLVHSPVRTLLYFVPAAAVPALGFFGTNYLAIGQWTPAYGEFGGPWYEFAGSHWSTPPGPGRRGIDWAFTRESRAAYILHFLIGHHGVFSLTPIWILSFAGMVASGRAALARCLGELHADGASDLSGWKRLRTLDVQAILALGTLLVSLVVIGFFLMRERWNYGGWSCGPRWLIWLTPMWLLTLLPAADWLGQRRGGRILGYLLLGLSVLSVSYPAWNPWRMPWLYDIMQTWGWLPY